MNIADFGGFAGIARMIKQIKTTSGQLIDLSKNTGVPEVLDFKLKYLDALDKFRPGNTQGVADIIPDYEKDNVDVIGALRTKVTDPEQLKTAEQSFNECSGHVNSMLQTVKTALKNAEDAKNAKKAG